MSVQRQSEIGVFGKRLQTEAACFIDRILADGADRTRHHRDAVQAVVSASVEIETARIFQRLTTRDERTYVSNFRVTRHGADARIGKWFQQTRERVALTLRIGIDENDDAGMYSTETALQCASFTPVFLRQQANARIGMPNALNFGSCLITRAVVHNDDFNFTLVVGRYKSAQSFCD